MIAFRELWPDKRTIFWTYVLTAVVLGLIGALLESLGLGLPAAVGVMAMAVLPAHYGIYRIRKHSTQKDQAQSVPPPPPPPRARAAGAGGD
jgi:hypothetical protein